MGTSTTLESHVNNSDTSNNNSTSIIATRERRQNAGNKLRQLLNAEESLMYEDEDIQDIFKEVEDDDEFDVNAASSEDFGSEEEEEEEGDDDNDKDSSKVSSPVQTHRTSKKRKHTETNDSDEEPQVKDDDMFSDSADSLSSSDDEDENAGELELQRQQRAEARQIAKKKRNTSFMPEAVLKAQKRRARMANLNKDKDSSEPPIETEEAALAAIERQRAAKREKLKVSTDQMLSANRRRSTRSAAVKNTQGVIQRLKESEARRAKMAAPTVRIVHKMTQEERLKEAIITEKKNTESLNIFYQQEDDRKKKRRAALLAKRAPMTSFIRYVSKTAYFDLDAPPAPLIEVLPDEPEPEHPKKEAKEPKKRREPKASKNDAKKDTKSNTPQGSLPVVNNEARPHTDITQIEPDLGVTVPSITDDQQIPIDPRIPSGSPTASILSSHDHIEKNTSDGIMLANNTHLSNINQSFSSVNDLDYTAHRDDDAHRRSTSVEQLEADYINFHVTDDSIHVDEDEALEHITLNPTLPSVTTITTVGTTSPESLVTLPISNPSVTLSDNPSLKHNPITLPTTSEISPNTHNITADLPSSSLLPSQRFPMDDIVMPNVEETKEPSTVLVEKTAIHSPTLGQGDSLSSNTIIDDKSISAPIDEHAIISIDHQAGEQIDLKPDLHTETQIISEMDLHKDPFTSSSPVNILTESTPANNNVILTDQERKSEVDTFKDSDQTQEDEKRPLITVEGPKIPGTVNLVSLMAFPESFKYTQNDIKQIMFGPQSLEIPVIPPDRTAEIKPYPTSMSATTAAIFAGRKKKQDKDTGKGKHGKRGKADSNEYASKHLADSPFSTSGGVRAAIPTARMPLTGFTQSAPVVSSTPLLARTGLMFGGMKMGIGVSGASVGPLGTGVIGSGGSAPGGLSTAAANAAAAAAAQAAAAGGFAGGSASARAKSAAALAALQAAPKCVVTGKPCKFVDPRTGVPYSSMEAFQMIRAVMNGNVPWNKDFGIYMGPIGPTARHAKGVPAGFGG